MISLTITARYGYVGRQPEDMFVIIVSILYCCLVVELTRTVSTQLALITELVGLQFTMMPREVILIPSL